MKRLSGFTRGAGRHLLLRMSFITGVAFLVSLLCVGTQTALARTLSIYPDCTSMPAGLGDAYCSIDEAAKAMKAGDVVLFKAGEHRLDKVYTLKPVGTKDAPCIIRGEDGAVLKGTFDKATNIKEFGPDEYSGFKLFGSWFRLEHLTFTNIGGAINVVGSNVVVKDVTVRDYSNYAFILNKSYNVQFDGLVASGSRFEHGVYITSEGGGIVFRNCLFEDTAVNGVHINGKNIHNVLIERCTFRNNSREWGACITQMNGASGIRIYNNLFYNNKGHIFTMGGKDVRIYGNTIYQEPSGREGQVFVVIAPLVDWSVKQNVFATNTRAFDLKSPAFLKGAGFDWNVYGDKASESSSFYGEQGIEPNGIIDADVEFVQAPSGTGEADLRLRSGSDGASGAPLLSELREDYVGAMRKDGGAIGAYAEPGH